MLQVVMVWSRYGKVCSRVLNVTRGNGRGETKV